MAYEMPLELNPQRLREQEEQEKRFRAATLSQKLRAYADAAGAMGRGALTGMVGIPGDLEDLSDTVRTALQGSNKGFKPETRVFPTSKEISDYLPQQSHGDVLGPEQLETFRDAGTAVSPLEAAKLPGATKAVIEGLRAPVPRTISKGVAGGQKGALYPGALRKDLLLSHNTAVDKLLKDGVLPKEAYNLSLGITKNKPMSFDMGNVVLVPHEGAFDPRTSPTSISAFDSYTPRYRQAGGTRADEAAHTLTLVKILKEHPQLMDNPEAAQVFREAIDKTKGLANQRLVDRFLSRFPRGGQMQEGSGLVPVGGLPRFGEGGYNRRNFDIENPELPRSAHMESYGKRFPTFQDYERSPLGAKRLDEGPQPSVVYEDINNFLWNNARDVKLRTGKSIDFTDDVNNSEKMMDALHDLAKMKVDNESPVKLLRLKNTAVELQRQLRRTKSDYGEVKAYGPVGIHRGNFAGIIADTNMPEHQYQALEKEARKRGLAIESTPLNTRSPSDEEEGFKLAKWLQNYAVEGKSQAISLPGFKKTTPEEAKALVSGLSNPMSEPLTPALMKDVMQHNWGPKQDALPGAPELKTKKPEHPLGITDKTQIKDLTELELDWMAKNDPGHPMFDVIK